MRNEIPILKFSSFTPEFSDTGIYLNASRFHGGAETTAVWLHGILALETNEFPPEDEQNWLDALNLVGVSESNQLPLIAKIVGNRIPVQDHSTEAGLDDGRTIRLLPFSFDLTDVLGRGLYDDNYYVHISARQYCSVPIRIVKDQASLPSYLEKVETSDPKFEGTDQLIQAYDSYSAGRPSEAMEFFSKALENEEILTDIDRPNFYNAAYCAGQYVLEADPGFAQQLLDKTTNWMQEDLRIRNSLLTQIQTRLLSKDGMIKTAQLEKKRLQLLQDLGLTNKLLEI